MADWVELDKCSEQVKNLAVLAETIHDAMYYGPHTEAAYLDSLALLGTLLKDQAAKLDALTQKERGY